MGTTDYYPILTPVVAKNPDVIDFSGGMKGDMDLMVKQARELGYKGILAGPAHGDPQSTIDIAGAAFAEGFLTNDPDYASDLYPESVRNLYAEFKQRYPGEPMPLTVYIAYGVIMIYVQAMEKAGSIDPDKVKAVIDDPNWTWEWFGTPGRSFGGVQTIGIRRAAQDEVALSDVINGKKVMISRKAVVIP
jgi:branched-chain amino acid transport system substrate-binding protein